MKASYRKTKLGYSPVIILDDKTRLTIKNNCLLKKTAVAEAEREIEKIKIFVDNSKNKG